MTNVDSGISTYDGSAFADYEDVIVVTTNYRTNGDYQQVH
jgi:carboxylesterase type B